MPVGTEPPPAPGKMRLQVGDWTVEPALNQLSAAGKTVKLEPKAMAVLVYLADRPGQVVSREALLSAVWSGVVVGDDSLTQVVIKLRKALGDVPEKPAYIQTISKGGYRLIAPVVRSEEIASAPVRPDAEPLSCRTQTARPMDSGSGHSRTAARRSRSLVDQGRARNRRLAESRHQRRAPKRRAQRNRPLPSGRSRRWATTRRRCCWLGASQRTS